MKEIEIDGLKAKLGRSDKENWELLDNAKSHHWWFHLDEAPSGHLFLEVDNSECKLNARQIYLSALQCRIHSKFKKHPTPVSVIYTQVSNITKGNTVGQVIVQGKRYTLKV